MIWETLLRLKEEVRGRESAHQFISVGWSGSDIQVAFDQLPQDTWLVIHFSQEEYLCRCQIKADAPFSLVVERNDFLQVRDLSLLTQYLPYVLLPYFGRKQHRCFAISHFAQTLDGRIAATSGDSKWIGNDENLRHSHRMRALTDAIMVGSRTLDSDNPQLTVRLVEGNNPVKVVVGGDDLDFARFNAVGEDTIVFCQNHVTWPPSFRKLDLHKDGTTYDPHEILRALYEQGLFSVYIEGGAFTTSRFIQQQAVDQVQVHISPKILGSGITGFNFDGVTSMDEAMQFSNSRFIAMGDQVMFTGEVRR